MHYLLFVLKVLAGIVVFSYVSVGIQKLSPKAGRIWWTIFGGAFFAWIGTVVAYIFLGRLGIFAFIPLYPISVWQVWKQLAPEADEATSNI